MDVLQWAVQSQACAHDGVDGVVQQAGLVVERCCIHDVCRASRHGSSHADVDGCARHACGGHEEEHIHARGRNVGVRWRGEGQAGPRDDEGQHHLHTACLCPDVEPETSVVSSQHKAAARQTPLSLSRCDYLQEQRHAQ